VRQAREKVNKLVSDMEETQRIEMRRFQENLENNNMEFNDKQQEEKENFSLKIGEEKRLFSQNQETRRNKFVSKMERDKYVFFRMQEDAREEFLSNERLNLDHFKRLQGEQRQSFQLTQKREELALTRSQQDMVEDSTNYHKAGRQLNLNANVSDLVGINSFSQPACLTVTENQQTINQATLTRSLDNSDMDIKYTQLGHRKSLPVMKPTVDKEHSVDRSACGQLSQNSPLLSVSEWRKTSCPANLNTNMIDPAQFNIPSSATCYPFTPPPSPTLYFTVGNDQSQMPQQVLQTPQYFLIPTVLNATVESKSSFSSRLSPMQSFSSNTSSNPSPVPSLEFISPNEMLTRIPETCPNIKALISSQEKYCLPIEDSQMKTPPNSPSTASGLQNALMFPSIDTEVGTLVLKEDNDFSNSSSLVENTNHFTTTQVSSHMLTKEIKHITPLHVTPQHVTPQHVTPQQVTPQHVTPQHVTPQHVTPQHAAPQHVTPHHVTPQHVSPQHVTPQHVTSQHFTPQHVTSQHVTPKHQPPENLSLLSKLGQGSPKSSLTPRLARKNAMEVVTEEDDDDEQQPITEDDEEIAELTISGITRNNSASFTHLVTSMQSHSPSKARGPAHSEEVIQNNKKKIFFLETENNSPKEDLSGSNDLKQKLQSLPEPNIEQYKIKENICKENSGISLASSTSSSSFKSAETSPVREYGCILV